MKISEDPEKSTLPGRKQVYRLMDADGGVRRLAASSLRSRVAKLLANARRPTLPGPAVSGCGGSS